MASPTLEGLPTELRLAVYHSLIRARDFPSLLRLSSVCHLLRREAFKLCIQSRYHHFEDINHLSWWLLVAEPDLLLDIQRLSLKLELNAWHSSFKELLTQESRVTGRPPRYIRWLYRDSFDSFWAAVDGDSPADASNVLLRKVEQNLRARVPSFDGLPYTASSYWILSLCLRKLPNLSRLKIDITSRISARIARDLTCLVAAASASDAPITHFELYAHEVDIRFLRLFPRLQHLGLGCHCTNNSKQFFKTLSSLQYLSSLSIVRLDYRLQASDKNGFGLHEGMLQRLGPFRTIRFLNYCESRDWLRFIKTDDMQALRYHRESLHELVIKHVRIIEDDVLQVVITMLQALFTDFPKLCHVAVELTIEPDRWNERRIWVDQAKKRGWSVVIHDTDPEAAAALEDYE
jgi:hypothetical protein